jgi:hypothetical protein
MNLATILKAIDAIGPVIGAVPAVIRIVENAIDALGEDDQQIAQAKLAEMRVQTDAVRAELLAAIEEAKD